jgi:hypothetical protein
MSMVLITLTITVLNGRRDIYIVPDWYVNINNEVIA